MGRFRLEIRVYDDLEVVDTDPDTDSDSDPDSDPDSDSDPDADIGSVNAEVSLAIYDHDIYL